MRRAKLVLQPSGTSNFRLSAIRLRAPFGHSSWRAFTEQSPGKWRSGKSHSVSMRRTCKRQLRDASYHWARTAIAWDTVAKAQYQALRARRSTYSRALRGVAGRLLSRLVAALKANSLYQSLHVPTASAT